MVPWSPPARGSIYSVAVSGDGARLYAAGSAHPPGAAFPPANGSNDQCPLPPPHAPRGCRDTMVKVWDLPTGEMVATLHGHERCVHTAALSPARGGWRAGEWGGGCPGTLAPPPPPPSRVEAVL